MPDHDLAMLPAGLGRPAHRALEGAGVQSLRDLTTRRARDIAALHGVGPSALRRLRAAMEDQGLAFADEQ